MHLESKYCRLTSISKLKKSLVLGFPVRQQCCNDIKSYFYCLLSQKSGKKLVKPENISNECFSNLKVFCVCEVSWYNDKALHFQPQQAQKYTDL